MKPNKQATNHDRPSFDTVLNDVTNRTKQAKTVSIGMKKTHDELVKAQTLLHYSNAQLLILLDYMEEIGKHSPVANVCCSLLLNTLETLTDVETKIGNLK